MISFWLYCPHKTIIKVNSGPPISLTASVSLKEQAHWETLRHQVVRDLTCFFLDGQVSIDDSTVPVKVFKGTGVMQSLIREGIAPALSTSRHVLLRGMSGRLVSPLHQLNLETGFYLGPANLAVVPYLPVNGGVDILLGNERVGNGVVNSISPSVPSVTPVSESSSNLDLFRFANMSPIPISVVTRSQAKPRQRARSLLAPLTGIIADLFQFPAPTNESSHLAGARVVAGAAG